LTNSFGEFDVSPFTETGAALARPEVAAEWNDLS